MTNEREMRVADDIVAERVSDIHDAITACGRGDVKIIAVTKGFDRSAIDCAQRIGLHDVGENYAQELLEKSEAIAAGTLVHFMGRIQRNKVRKIVEHVDLWHSVARPEILVELAKRTEAPEVLIQVRPLDDPTKDGVRPDELDSMLEVAQASGVTVRGLMTIGLLGDETATRECFVELDRLADNYGLVERSMGMSGDYRDALEAGSTMLRVGSVLFGDRPAR